MRKDSKKIIAGLMSTMMVASLFTGVGPVKTGADEAPVELTIPNWKFTHQGVNDWNEPGNVGIINSVTMTGTEESVGTWPKTLKYSAKATQASTGFDMEIGNTGWDRTWSSNSINPWSVTAELDEISLEEGHKYAVTFDGSASTHKYCYVGFDPAPFGGNGLTKDSDNQIIELEETEKSYYIEFINWEASWETSVQLMFGAFAGTKDFAGNPINIREEVNWNGTVHIRNFKFIDLGYTKEYEDGPQIGGGDTEDETDEIASKPAYTGAEKSNAYALANGYNGGDLVWSDEFDGDKVSTASWNFEKGNNNGWGNEEKQSYISNSKNLFIADISNDKTSDDGKALAIHAQRENNGTYTSARIQTSGKHSFKYGRMEARIKFDNGMCNGVWPAFWMLGDGEPMGWPYCGEIDIMEHKNADKNVISTLHWNHGDDTSRPYTEDFSGGNTTIPGGSINDWHVYAVDWNSKNLTFYIDDVKIATVKVTEQMDNEFNKHEHYFVLNMAIGGRFIGGALPSDDWAGSTMYVDYVRAYQKTTISTNTGTWKKSSIWEKSAEDPTEAPTNTPADSNNTTTEAPTNSQPSGSNNATTTKAPETTTVAPATTKAPETIKLGKAKIKKAARAKNKKKVKLTLKKVKGATAYEINVSTSKKFAKKSTKAYTSKKLTKTIKKLKASKKYYVRVRAIAVAADGTKSVGAWSKVKKIK
jgi:beta-glucanase (GH16 family)